MNALEGMKVCEYHIGDNNNYYVTTAACARGTTGLSVPYLEKESMLPWVGGSQTHILR